MKFYYNLLSQPSRALYILLKMSPQLAVDFIPVDLLNGEHLADDFKAVNRFQKVPCIVEADGWQLAESIAILRYLTTTHATIPEHFYPTETRARAAVDEYLEWQHNNTRLGCAIYFQIRKRIGAFAAISDDPEGGALPLFRFLMESTLDAIESLWLRGKKFIATETHVSFADIIAACEIEQPRMAGYDVFEGRPRLREWYERVRAATQPHYDDAHVVVNKIAARALKAKI